MDKKPINIDADDLAAVSNEMKKMEQVAGKSKKLISDLLSAHGQNIYLAYKKNGNELAISLKLVIKGDAKSCVIGADISYVTEKIKDGTQGAVTFGQQDMFEKSAAEHADEAGI